MNLQEKKAATHVKNYALIAITLFLSWISSIGVNSLLHSSFLAHSEGLHILPTLLHTVIIFALGFFAYELSKPTIIPSFVLAIFFGFLTQGSLVAITENSSALSLLTTIGAALILFGGGLDTPFSRFKALVGPILSIAFLGTIITALAFSFTLILISHFFDLQIPLSAMILLGVALASTDPAAIIPSLKSLLFRNPRVKHIAVSESALNDVVGALLTSIFIGLFAIGYIPKSLSEAYGSLFNLTNLGNIFKVVVLGAGIGVCGFLILHLWSKWKKKNESEGEADAALFLAVPLLSFALATALGGNGFLAVFVTGLLFQLDSHVEHVEHFFNHTIEGFMKPLIFMLLGGLLNLQELIDVAGMGIVMGGIFMFVLRPIVVFLTLSPFIRGRHKMEIKELVFLSFVRETGVIPAVLLVGISVAGISGSSTIMAIGMWVILCTLLLQPPLTPWLAKKLGIAEDLPVFPKQKENEPVAVLCSRGYSFLDRLDAVVDWCQNHNTEHVVLLHCPEDKYSEEFLQKVKEIAAARFKSMNKALAKENKKKIEFKFMGMPGSLEENIVSLVENGKVVIIFVGQKMLDYRIENIKALKAPFVFLE